MLTKEQVLAAVKGGRKSKCIDSRDYSRLIDWFGPEDWPHFGFELEEGAESARPRPWTQEAIVERMRADVAFGFEKALDKRGLSANAMFHVVKQWLWVLEDPLAGEQSADLYTYYGLPLLKAVALKYGFDTPIGDDSGNEPKYGDEE